VAIDLPGRFGRGVALHIAIVTQASKLHTCIGDHSSARGHGRPCTPKPNTAWNITRCPVPRPLQPGPENLPMQDHGKKGCSNTRRSLFAP